MSEQDQYRDEDPGKDQTTEPAEPQSARGGRGTGLIAGLALVLAVFALAFSAWQWLQVEQQPGAQLLADLEAGLTDAGSGMDSLQQALENLDDRVGDLEGVSAERQNQLAAIEGDLTGVQPRFDQFDSRLEELERELLEQIHQLYQREDSQREVDRQLDRRLLLIEIAALLRLGQARAELAGDFPGARAAYRESASLLARADDPRLGSVRRQLAAELEALESVRTPDWLRAQTRVERLSKEVGNWPLAQPNDDVSQDILGEQHQDAPEDRGWRDSVRGALGQLVTVRPRDQTPVTDEQLEIIRESLRMRLAAAELALGRRDMAELDHHLGRVAATLNSHFRTDDETVRRALDVLEDVRRMEPETAPEGLGRALAALREHMDGS